MNGKTLNNEDFIQTGKEAVEKLHHPHDPYNLRCAPQVLDAARGAIAYTKRIVAVEINSATDNSLVFRIPS